jgi:hypothetical protein
VQQLGQSFVPVRATISYSLYLFHDGGVGPLRELYF